MKQNYLKSFCARCVTLLVLALLSTNLAWGEEISFSKTHITSSTSGTAYVTGPSDLTLNGQTWKATGYRTVKNESVIIGKGGANYLETPLLEGNITSIKVMWSGNASYYLALQTTSGTEIEAKSNTSSESDYTFTIKSGEYKQLRLVGRRASSTDNAAATISSVTVYYTTVKSTDATATFTINGDVATFTEGVCTKNVTWDDATESFSIAVTPAAKATISNVIGATNVGAGSYTMTSPSVGNTATASFTITAEDGTTTKTYTISIVKGIKPTETYTVTFNAGTNGTCETTSLTEASAGAGVELPSCTPNQGYAFLGWSTEENPTSADAGVAGETYKPTSNCTLYAYYGNLYSVTLKDTDPATVLTQETYGGSVELPSRTCVNPAYTFAGWSTTNVAEETETAPTIIPAGAYTPTASIELYPIFKRTVSSGEVTWDVVTNASNLAADDVVVIAAGGDTNYAMSTTQNNNNRAQTAITKSNNNTNISWTGEDVQQLTLKTGTKTGTFAFYTGSGYLYAAGANTNNYLKTQNNIDDKASFTITISNKDATITAVAEGVSRNVLRYNPTNNPPLFSCYESGKQSAPYIYKKNESSTTYYTSNPPTESLQDPVIAVEEGEYWGAMSVEITQNQGKEIYYTIDGSDPKEEGSLYEAPVPITESCTLKAVAKDGEDYSGVVTAEYTIHPTTANVPVTEALTSVPEHWRQVGSWTFNNYGAVVEGTDEAWLISPQIVKEKDTYAISYESASKEGTADKLELYYSTDYDHSTNNYATATWIKIESCPNVFGGWTLTESTPTLTIDDNVTFAFKYTDNKQWEFKNFSVVEKYGTQTDGTASFAEANIFVEKTKSADSPALTTNNTEGVKTYESDNTDVATVNATTGEVTAVSEGVATITVTIAENANYTECSASYTVTVTPEGNWWYEDWTGTTSKTVINTYDSRYTVTGEDTKIAANSYAGGVAPELMLKGTWTIDLSETVADGVYNLQYYSNGNPEVSVVGATIGKAEVTTISGTAKKYVVPVVVNDDENFSITFTITGDAKRLDNIALILDHDTKTFAKTISNRKMATLYLDYAVTIPTDVKAYTAADNGDHTAITLEKITDGVIPANTGVIVYADVNESTSFKFVETATTKTYDNNCLKGVTEKTVYNKVADYDADTYNYYALMAGEGTSVVFKLVNGGSYAANSAYLVLPKTNAAKVEFTFGDEPTGIESLTPALSEGKGVYNLQGVRVNNGYKGIVIMNGKKYINK